MSGNPLGTCLRWCRNRAHRRVNSIRMAGRPPGVLVQAEAAALIQRAKLRLLEMHYQSKVGHIGGNLSALDLLMSLYHFRLGPNDQFVLAKGHSAGALYVTLWTMGVLSDEDLRHFHGEGTRLSGHPPLQGIPEIIFATGSLGHGLSLAAGLALGKRLRGEGGRVFCLTSDGEWNEGSCWEALIFLAHQKLDNLTFLVDLNGMQGFGSTRQVANLDSLADKFRAFGVKTIEVDGHDVNSICSALESSDGPLAIVANTTKGCGVSFMENQMAWHYLPMSEEQYQQAVREVTECGKLSVTV
jgi:transketolase